MAVSTDSPFAKAHLSDGPSKRASLSGKLHARSKSTPFGAILKKSTAPRPSIDTSSQTTKVSGINRTADFSGDVDTNNDLPSREALKKIEDFPVLDQDGRAIPFKTLYTGPNVARRVLIIFIRHFFCGVITVLSRLLFKC